MSIAAAANTQNNSGGNGQFSSLRRQANQNNNNSFNSEVFDQNDSRMRFRNSVDPIYVAFDYVDSQPISKLATSFVKDSIFGIMNFVSSVVKS